MESEALSSYPVVRPDHLVSAEPEDDQSELLVCFVSNEPATPGTTFRAKAFSRVVARITETWNPSWPC